MNTKEHLKDDTSKIQTAEKVSELNLWTGNIENAKDMAFAFNKLFLLTLIIYSTD